jgi:ketosteroid isomerase-like protein
MSTPAPTPGFVQQLFQAIDAMDAEKFVTFLADDGVFRFGNFPAAKGREAAREAVAQFFGSIHAVRHRLLGVWSLPDVVFCEGEVTYTRKDRSEITLPFFNLLKMQDGKVREYSIYADVTPLYQPQGR